MYPIYEIILLWRVTMSLILFVGSLIMLVIIFFKNPILSQLGKGNPFVHLLKKTPWFQSHWRAGILLFFMNTALFSTTILALYIVGYFVIPYVHLIFMVLAVCTSIYLWVSVNKAWQGSKGDRLKLATIGSSFYMGLTVLFTFLYITLEPSYQGEDIFMQAMGLFLAIIVTTTAWITCFFITGFYQQNMEKIR